MALQTGQITVLEGNTVVNVEKQIRFIFTKNSGERITRDTTAKGVINFDIPNGDWNVSWFPVTGNQRVIPLRAGLQLKITSSTPATALADWIYGGNTHVADPILAQWTTVLDEMKSVRDEFRKETSFVGDGKIMREGAWGLGVRGNRSREFDFVAGVEEIGFYDAPKTAENNPLSENGVVINLNRGTTVAGNWGVMLYASDLSDNILFRRQEGGRQNDWAKILHSKNTTTDSNGFLKAASPIINLFADHIEPNDHFSQKYEKEPIFEKLDIGVYKISTTKGLAKGEYPGDWNVEIPKDINGERYFNTEWQQLEDDTVIIRTYEREAFTEEYQRYDEEGNVLTDPNGNLLKFYKRHEINGDPVDIKEGRFIALRFVEDEEAKAKREADAIKAQEEFEAQERLRKEAEELAEKEANARYEAEMARQEAEMLAEMEVGRKEE